MKNPILNLLRISDTGIETFGVLLFNKHPICATLELPWKENQHEISCIPTGFYNCTYELNPKKGPCFRLQNVSNRDGILIHAANEVHELKGCIAPGMTFEQSEFVGVGHSKDAIRELEKISDKGPFTLEVRACSSFI